MRRSTGEKRGLCVGVGVFSLMNREAKHSGGWGLNSNTHPLYLHTVVESDDELTFYL